MPGVGQAPGPVLKLQLWEPECGDFCFKLQGDLWHVKDRRVISLCCCPRPARGAESLTHGEAMTQGLGCRRHPGSLTDAEVSPGPTTETLCVLASSAPLWGPSAQGDVELAMGKLTRSSGLTERSEHLPGAQAARAFATPPASL